MTRIEETIKRHDKGYNCAQAIACTYCDLVGMDEETMFKVAEGLGLGVGCMEGTCGAITGACILAGCKNSTGDDSAAGLLSTIGLALSFLGACLRSGLNPSRFLGIAKRTFSLSSRFS